MENRVQFLETRGRKEIPLESKQLICDIWFQNSIPSVDCRNGRESVSMRNSIYIRKNMKDINHGQPLIEEKKRGTVRLKSTRRIMTCTLEKIKEVIEESNGLKISIGTIWNYKPFYIVYPTEKERLLCLCKTCLNKRLLFNSLRKNCKELGESLTSFLMGLCNCSKESNGFWKLQCCLGKCKECINCRNEIDKPNFIEIPVSFYLFEETKTIYQSKKSGEWKESKKLKELINWKH